MSKSPVIADIRRNIKAEMTRLGLKSKPLSQQADLSESAVRDLMGKVSDPRIGTLLGLANAMNVPVSILIGEMVPVVGTIGDNGQVTALESSSELQMVPRPPSREPDLVAWRVKGSALFPAYRDGDVIYGAPCQKHKTIGCCSGRECIVQPEEGPAYLRVVWPGSFPGRSSLRWYSLPDMDVGRLAWVAPVAFVMRSQIHENLIG